MEEKEMYPLVEEYFKRKLKQLGFGSDILSGNASRTDLSLPLFGSYIRPDVYAVGEDKNGLFRIFMGEGKLTYKGRDLDGVIWQAMSDQRFSHFVYIFFPVNELKDAKEALEFIKEECNKYGLGLLLVDIETNNVDEVLPAKLSSHLLNEKSIDNFEKNVMLARNKIRLSLGKDRELEYVHLTTLRDLAIILTKKEKWNMDELFGKNGELINLLDEYRKRKNKSSIQRYDKKVVQKCLDEGDIQKFREVMERNLNTLQFFDIIDISSDGFITVKPICKLMASLDKNNKYSSDVGEQLRQFLSYLLLTSEGTRTLVNAICTILKDHHNLPVWAREGDCPHSKECKKECGFRGKWNMDGQPFPDDLEYDSNRQLHICKAFAGRIIEVKNPSITSILYCTYKIKLPERIKILISESTLVEQKGRRHEWSLAI